MVGMVDQRFHHTRILSLHHDAAGGIESRQVQCLKSKFMNFVPLRILALYLTASPT